MTTNPTPSSIHLTSLSDLIFFAFSLFVFYSSPPNFNPIPNRRRFFKFLIMPLTTTVVNKISAANRHHFATPQSLSDWLRPRLPSDSFADWLRPHHNRLLIELHQQLSNGDIRNRSRPLSEKTKPGETVEAAVVRAVREELGSIIRVSCSLDKHEDFMKIIPDSY